MVVIIDDREDVWSSVPNLIVVKPYQFFKGAGDIHSPTDSIEASKGSLNEKEVTRTDTKVSVPEKPALISVDTNQEGKIEATEENRSEKEVTDSHGDDKSSHSSLSRSSSQSSVSSSDSDSKKEDKVNGDQEETIQDEQANPSQTSATVTKVPESKGKISVQSPRRKTSRVLNKAMLALEESDKDNYLNYLSETLSRIHSAFYEEFNQMGDGSPYPDVREIIPHMRSKVLQGVNIVFSSVFPTNIIQPENHPIWRVATSLGATVSTSIIPPKDESATNPAKKQKCEETDGLTTTHVVAAKSDTFKAHQARKIHGVYLVSPDWLWCCGERWEWVDEKLFPVDDLPVAIDLSDDRLVRPGNQEKDRLEKTVMAAAKQGERLVSREDLAEMDREVDEVLGSDASSSNSEESLDSGTTLDQASNGFLLKMAGSLSPSDAESEESSEDGETGQSSSDEDDMAAMLDEEISHF